ncbi:hypothetical protein CR194_13710 [Salipaludibacillus keqinensis]|uniref:Uncharacterized protein n=1 Tax=Salipaludibacillus keqinensis TaxID=2045207 RepID=A0A323TC13_9BACI|nr:hypothetical protein [Salipaludibacillus keqinensis]PYZ92708.1 hypothetical protein CR194_13710 [Salipaludibacillus keqinensis]
METVVIGSLISFAILLLIISFFKKDKSKEVDKKIENFSITLMTEMNQINKKVDMLEGEVFLNEKERAFAEALFREREKKKKIMNLFEKGYSNDQIARETNEPEDDIEAIITLEMAEREVLS